MLFLSRMLAILGMAMAAAAQPAFDVASLKAVPSAPGDYHADLGTALHGEVTLTNATLSECLRFAFEINNNDQISGPEWIKSREFRFNIVAKAPPDTPLPQLRSMLQNLLIERLRIALRHEQPERAFLALTAGKKGTKLQPAHDGPPAPGGRQIMGTIIANRMSMAQLTVLLSRFMHQPVLDVTGLAGDFEVKLEWTPENLQAPPPADPADRPSIYAAVQEQLGLVLERRKGPLDVIVVDRADKTPVEN